MQIGFSIENIFDFRVGPPLATANPANCNTARCDEDCVNNNQDLSLVAPAAGNRLANNNPPDLDRIEISGAFIRRAGTVGTDG